ncbi:MAG: acetate--CoA ligase family protein [Candidatus Krumholzibacteriota bacterium]|nr:acetate--CoA ligase family protein [Candidatus Krumholzibacteriota bacterium]
MKKRALDDSTIRDIETKLLAVLDGGRTRLYEHEIYELLGRCGLKTPAFAFFTREEEIDRFDLASIPADRVVCKLISEQMVHRSEQGGIRFIDYHRDGLRQVFRSFQDTGKRLGISLAGMMIAEQLPIVEGIPHQLLLSLRQDQAFGPVVVLGLGGLGTEIYRSSLKNEKALFIRPAGRALRADENLEALEKTMFFPILAGKTRISPDPLVDTGILLEVLEKFAYLAEIFSRTAEATTLTIEELEINPLQITSRVELVALDGLMTISRSKIQAAAPPQSKIDHLLEPESVLIIGASGNKMNMGRVILKNILSREAIPRENIFLLHPRETEIEGCRAFSSLAGLPHPVDMVVFTIPAGEESVKLLEEIILGEMAESILLISGGFREIKSGEKLSRRLAEAIVKGRGLPGGGTVVNGPNCMGIVSKPGGYNTFFVPEYKLSFTGKFGQNCAVISQSGAWLVTLLSSQAKILNPKYMITVGNQIDLTLTDHLINLRQDADIDLFCVYAEGFKPGDGARFLRTAREVIEAGKRIVLYKAGRTAAGAAAVASHTAAMAGDYDILFRLLSEAGICVTDDLEECEDAVKVMTLLEGKRITGRRVGISSDAGFECSIAADRLYSMELADFSATTMEKLNRSLPAGIIDVHNPVDATPAITTAQYAQCVRAILEDENTDCAVISNVASTSTQENLPPGPGHREDIHREHSHPNMLIRLFRQTNKPMVVSMNEGAIFDPAVSMMEEAGIPVFRKIDRAMRAMDLFLRYGSRKK